MSIVRIEKSATDLVNKNTLKQLMDPVVILGPFHEHPVFVLSSGSVYALRFVILQKDIDFPVKAIAGIQVVQRNREWKDLDVVQQTNEKQCTAIANLDLRQVDEETFFQNFCYVSGNDDSLRCLVLRVLLSLKRDGSDPFSLQYVVSVKIVQDEISLGEKSSKLSVVEGVAEEFPDALKYLPKASFTFNLLESCF